MAAHASISGHDVAVRAQIRRIESYSAHADQEDLLRWMYARKPIEGSLVLTHGESGSTEALRRLAQAADLTRSIILPRIGECYALPEGAPARRLKTGRVEVREAVTRDWQNDYADFATRLKRELAEIESASARRARMSTVLRSFREERTARHSRSNAKADRK